MSAPEPDFIDRTANGLRLVNEELKQVLAEFGDSDSFNDAKMFEMTFDEVNSSNIAMSNLAIAEQLKILNDNIYWLIERYLIR